MYKVDLLAFCWVRLKSLVPLFLTFLEALHAPSQPSLAMACADDISSAAELLSSFILPDGFSTLTRSGVPWLSRSSKSP